MNDELYHHGVDGQRWGIKHGPPYPLDRSAARQEAKKRKARRKNMIKINKKRKKSKQAAEKRDLTYKKSKKPAKQMTNKELNDTIDRLQREETYRKLVSKGKTESDIEKQLKKQNKLADKQRKQNLKQQKIQNEAQKEQRKLQEEQLALQKKQFKRNKKLNGITHKIVDKVLVSAAGVAGTQITKKLIDQYINFNKDNSANTDNTSNKDPLKEAMAENKKKQEQIEKELNSMKKEPLRLESSIKKEPLRLEAPKKEAYQPMFLDVYSGPRGQYTEDYINKYLLEWGDGL